MEPATEGAPAPQRRPVMQTYPGDETCLVELGDGAGAGDAKMDRISLMIAAALPGASVTRTSHERAQLAIHVASYHQDSLVGVSATLLNEMLLKLPHAPVLTLQRHPSKPYIWLLVMAFCVQRDHLYALRRIPGIQAATMSRDDSYDGQMVELFIPAFGLDGNEEGGNVLLGAIQQVFNFEL